MSYEFVGHTADIQLRITANSLSALFRDAAEGMMEYIFGAEVVGETHSSTERCEVSGTDLEDLLVAWLSALLLLTQVQYVRVASVMDVQIGAGQATAQLALVPAQALEEIKAVTYHNLCIEEQNGRYTATVTFDL